MSSATPESSPSSTAGRELRISRVLRAPRALVWEAMTDPQQVTKWWGPRGFSTLTEVMDLRVGGTWKHVMVGPDGTRYPNKSIFREITPIERIVYTHGGAREGGPGVAFTATWTFEELGPRETRLTIHQLFDTAEQRDLIVREYGAEEGAKQTLERLSEHLSRMGGAQELQITRTVNAPRDLVWQVYTQPEHLAHWWGPKGFTMEKCTVDLRRGGLFHYGMKAPNGMIMWGRFLYHEIVPPQKLVFVVSFSDEKGGITANPFSKDPWPPLMLNEVTFTEENGQTVIAMRATAYECTPEERATFEKTFDNMRQGFAGTFAQLDEYLAKLTKS